MKRTMKKWQWLLGVASVTQLAWGVGVFIEYARSVGAPPAPIDGWVFSGLGLLGLLGLAAPRCALSVAIVQFLAGCYALCHLPVAIVCLQLPTGLSFLPPPIATLILMVSGTAAFLC